MIHQGLQSFCSTPPSKPFPPPTPPTPPPHWRRYKAGECFTCHVPTEAGKKVSVLVSGWPCLRMAGCAFVVCFFLWGFLSELMIGNGNCLNQEFTMLLDRRRERVVEYN